MIQSRVKQQGGNVSIAGDVFHVMIVFCAIIGIDVWLIRSIWFVN